MKRVIVVLGMVVMFVFLVSAPNVMAQTDFCEGDFDYDGDQDGTKSTIDTRG